MRHIETVRWGMRRRMGFVSGFSIATFFVLAAMLAGSYSLFASESEGVALAIIFDTSGSMNEPVKDSNGNQAPKYKIACRALVEIAHQIQTFTTNGVNGTPRKVDAGLFVFSHAGAKVAVPFAPFNVANFENWATNFNKPDGDTPLGASLVTAAATVRHSPLSRKHVLVITDGLNTQGPEPSATLPKIQRDGGKDHTAVVFHFVAFDVDARQFAPLKKLGATVVGAADEKQLGTQLNLILQHQILLEDEDAAKH